ncbi:MAG: Chorismate dehydratase [Chlamydiales bacterium]|nr:Chorismate dehydratase [Chlamydiales bacterium]
MTHIGMVEYINALPFHLPFRLGEIKTEASITYGIPSAVNAQLRAGKLDMALTSCAEYFDGPYQLLPGFCIGACKEILSVNLYTRLPKLDGATIAVTHHSATSIALLKVLCHHFWKVEPTFIPLEREKPLTHYDAFLLIGDEALEQLTIPGYQTIDLASAWYEATQLPFVFAVFAQRGGAHDHSGELEASLQWSEANRGRLIHEAHLQSGLAPELIDRYYTLCRYRLEDKEREGLNLFQQLREHVSKVCA